MKLTTKQLRKMIKEEIEKVSEASYTSYGKKPITIELDADEAEFLDFTLASRCRLSRGETIMRDIVIEKLRGAMTAVPDLEAMRNHDDYMIRDELEEQKKKGD